jgi:hypothetical protein
VTPLRSTEDFQRALEAALVHARQLAAGGRPSMVRIAAELDDLAARTRSGSPPPRAVLDAMAFDLIAARELEEVDDAYCEELSQLAAFARAWPR